MTLSSCPREIWLVLSATRLQLGGYIYHVMEGVQVLCRIGCMRDRPGKGRVSLSNAPILRHQLATTYLVGSLKERFAWRRGCPWVSPMRGCHWARWTWGCRGRTVKWVCSAQTTCQQMGCITQIDTCS